MVGWEIEDCGSICNEQAASVVRPTRSSMGSRNRRTHWIEAIGVSEGIVITFLQFQALKSCLARAKPWQRLGTYGTPEFGVVASCDDSAL
jgi:hypothetical protein